MTTHPIDTEALAKRAGYILFTDGPEQPAATARETCVLLDLLAAAEHRIARLEAQTSVRGRAVVMYRERAREAETGVENWRKQYEQDTDYWAHAAEAAEARIKAVRDVLDNIDTSNDPALHDGFADIRRALDGDA